MATNVIGQLGRLCFRREPGTYGSVPDNADMTSATAIYCENEGVNYNREYVEDPAFVGERFTTDMIPTAVMVDGSLDITVHPEQLGDWVYFTAGDYKSPKADDGTSFIIGLIKAPDGCVVVSYHGSETSCLISKTTTNLLSKIGDTDSESADSNFGTAGTIDLTSITTCAALQAEIDSYTDYSAYLIDNGTALTANIRDFADTKAKDQSIKLESVDAGFITVTYTGSEASCLLSKSGDNLVSKIGALGAEAADSNFGVAGTLDLSLAANDTLTEIQAIIDAYADYTATAVVGSGSLLTTYIPDFTDTQIKSTTKTLYSAEVFRHRFVPTSAGETVPSLYLLIDRIADIYGYTGVKINEASFTFEPRAIVKASVSLVGQDETLVDGSSADLTYPDIDLECSRPIISSKVDVYINGVKTNECKSVTLSINQNMDTESTILGSELIKEPQPRKGEINLDMQFYYNSDTLEYRTRYNTGDEMEVVISGEAFEYADSGETIPYRFWVRFAKCITTNAPVNLNTADTIMLPLTVSVVKPRCNSGIYSPYEFDVYTTNSDYEV